MNTTSLRIEIAIIGFQSAACLVFLWHQEIFSYWRSLSADDLSSLTAIGTLVIVALCYTLGAMLDSVTAIVDDWIPYYCGFRSEDKKIIIMMSAVDHSQLRLKYREAYEIILSSDFDLRLLRSTTFNLAAIAAISYYLGNSGPKWLSLIAAFLVAAAWLRRRNRRSRRVLKLLASLGLAAGKFAPARAT